MTDSLVMMALGEYRFGIGTAAYDELTRNTDYRWEAQSRIGIAPAQQFLGPGEDTVELSGVIYPHFVRSRGGLEQPARMRATAALGEPLLMVDGAGRVWGQYVITAVRETQKVFFSDGTPRAIEFGLSLKAYGGETATASALGPLASVGVDAISTSVPDLQTTLAGFSSITSIGPNTVNNTASKIALASGSARQLVGLTTSGLASIGGLINTGRAALGGALDAVHDVANPLVQTAEMVGRFRRSATAVAETFDDILSPASYQAFASTGRNLDSILASASGDTTQFQRVVESVAEINPAQRAGVLSRVFSNAGDKLALFNALVDEVTNG